MKIMLDTNVLISALVFGGVPQELISRLLLSGHDIYISEYVRQEFRETVYAKWPEKSEQLLNIFEKMAFFSCESSPEETGTLRDRKDIPILSDAIFNRVDILLTGDRDFLEADIENPMILSPRMLLEYLDQQ